MDLKFSLIFFFFLSIAQFFCEAAAICVPETVRFPPVAKGVCQGLSDLDGAQDGIRAWQEAAGRHTGQFAFRVIPENRRAVMRK